MSLGREKIIPNKTVGITENNAQLTILSLIPFYEFSFKLVINFS